MTKPRTAVNLHGLQLVSVIRDLNREIFIFTREHHDSCPLSDEHSWILPCGICTPNMQSKLVKSWWMQHWIFFRSDLVRVSIFDPCKYWLGPTWTARKKSSWSSDRHRLDHSNIIMYVEFTNRKNSGWYNLYSSSHVGKLIELFEAHFSNFPTGLGVRRNFLSFAGHQRGVKTQFSVWNYEKL